MRFLLTEVFTGHPAEFSPEDADIPYLGDHVRTRGILPDGGRIVMSHETIDSGSRRVVYMVRDPRAVALSEFRWLLRRGLFEDDQEAFVGAFVRGRSNPWGAWGRHVERWRGSSSARASRLLTVRYEDLKANPAAALAEVVTWLGADPDRDLIAAAVEHNAIEAMREKEDRAPDTAFAKGVDRGVRFVREGSVEGWRTALTGQQVVAVERAFGPVMRTLDYEPEGS